MMGFFFMNQSAAQSTEPSTAKGLTLTVNLKGMSTEKGEVSVGLYNEEGQWLKQTYKGLGSPVVGGTGRVVFEDLPEGVYAISTFHDINSNGELDSNFMGIPKEPYGFSNDAKGLFGPASFKDSKFEVVKDSEISINF